MLAEQLQIHVYLICIAGAGVGLVCVRHRPVRRLQQAAEQPLGEMASPLMSLHKILNRFW